MGPGPGGVWRLGAYIFELFISSKSYFRLYNYIKKNENNCKLFSFSKSKSYSVGKNNFLENVVKSYLKATKSYLIQYNYNKKKTKTTVSYLVFGSYRVINKSQRVIYDDIIRM